MSRLRILGVHNYYLQPGGEDTSFAQDMSLMERRGHPVARFTRTSEELVGRSPLGMAANAIWSTESHDALRRAVREHNADVVHFQNTFPVISPAAIHAAKAEGAATVMSLRNYRLFCANGLLMREGAPCELCLEKSIGWPAIRYVCYRESRSATSVVVAMNAIHHAIGTWTRKVDRFIALTEFARAKVVRGGLPAGRVRVSGNFLSPDPGRGEGRGRFFLYVGRLSDEKGIGSLLDAWSGLDADGWRLLIAGSGPEDDRVRQASQKDPSIEPLGQLSAPQVLERIGEAAALVFPSHCYEGMPRTIIESFSRGTPVLAFALGAMQEMLVSGRTGFLHDPGDSAQLGARMQEIIRDPDLVAALREACRSEYLEKYTEQAAYERLSSIYREAIGPARAGGGGNAS